jgi:arylsulfatase A-like enzyme
MGSLFTGRIDAFSAVEKTLAEVFQAAGHRTLAVIPSEVLRYVGRTLLTRGFAEHTRLINDRFEQDVGSYTTAPRTTLLGLELLDRTASLSPRPPFFLWLHYFDLHEHDEISLQDRRLKEFLPDPMPPDQPRRVKYQAILALLDREIGALTAALEERGLWEHTIVVLFGDHGESLGEDPRLPQNHGKYLYNPLVHVPLALRIPGLAGQRVEAPVSLLDLYPTLTDLLHQDRPLPCDGASLLPHLVDSSPEALRRFPHPLPLHESDQFGVIFWPYKLLVRPAENLTELYHLERDFAERNDLSHEEPEKVRELWTLYHSLPKVTVDRTPRGRWLRELSARERPADP